MADIVERLQVCAQFDPDQADAIEEIKRLRSQNAALLQAEAKIAATIGDRFLLDPPDGGSVDLIDGVERMHRSLKRLRTQNAQLIRALHFYADKHYPDVNSGPWGVNSVDFGFVARAALVRVEGDVMVDRYTRALVEAGEAAAADQKTAWINVYHDDTTRPHWSRESADYFAMDDRVALIEVEFQNGKPASVMLHELWISAK